MLSPAPPRNLSCRAAGQSNIVVELEEHATGSKQRYSEELNIISIGTLYIHGTVKALTSYVQYTQRCRYYHTPMALVQCCVAEKGSSQAYHIHRPQFSIDLWEKFRVPVIHFAPVLYVSFELQPQFHSLFTLLALLLLLSLVLLDSS